MKRDYATDDDFDARLAAAAQRKPELFLKGVQNAQKLETQQDRNLRAVHDAVKAFRDANIKRASNAEWSRIVQLGVVGLIFVFLAGICEIVLALGDQAIWSAAVLVVCMLVCVVGMCGPRSQDIVGVFSLVVSVFIIAEIYFWMRNINSVYKHYYTVVDYSFYWALVIFETINLGVLGGIYIYLRDIDSQSNFGLVALEHIQVKEKHVHEQIDAGMLVEEQAFSFTNVVNPSSRKGNGKGKKKGKGKSGSGSGSTLPK